MGAYARQFLRRDEVTDIDCARSSARLSIARSILRAAGVEPISRPTHDPGCICHPDNAWNRLHGYSYVCDPGCTFRSQKVEWAEWVKPEMFDKAWALANEVQTDRGAFNRRSV